MVVGGRLEIDQQAPGLRHAYSIIGYLCIKYQRAKVTESPRNPLGPNPTLPVARIGVGVTSTTPQLQSFSSILFHWILQACLGANLVEDPHQRHGLVERHHRAFQQIFAEAAGDFLRFIVVAVARQG